MRPQSLRFASGREDHVELPDGLSERLAAYVRLLTEFLDQGGWLSTPKPSYIGGGDVEDAIIGRRLARSANTATGVASPTELPGARGAAGRRGPDVTVPQADIYDAIIGGRSYVVGGRGGSGKSVLLESFARTMASSCDRLLGDGEPIAAKLRVPLLVPLREFNGTDARGLSIASLLGGAVSALAPGPALTVEDVNWLAAEGALVPMFDGFDEFAHRSDFCHLLRAAKAPERQLCRCAFVVTSRPDAEASGLPVDADGYRTLEPLTAAEVVDYIIRVRRLAAGELDRTPDVVRRLLVHPLYLCLWCNSVAAQGVPPGSLDELMVGLFANYMERRGHLPSLAECRRGRTTLLQREQRLAALHAAYAKVCYRLAVGGFGHPVPATDLASLDVDLDPMLDVGRPAGIVEPVLAIGRVEVYANRIPVVEHLFARELSRRLGADASPAERCAAVDLFRQWVWRPALRETFDHLFDRLWNSGRPDLERAGRGLIEWLVNVSRSDLIWAKPAELEPTVDEHAQDDLCCTFSFAALRWTSLSNSILPEDATLLSVLAEVHRQSLKVPLWVLGNSPELIGRPCASAGVMVAVACANLAMAGDAGDALARRLRACMGVGGSAALAVSIVGVLLDQLASDQAVALAPAIANTLCVISDELPADSLVQLFISLFGVLGDRRGGEANAYQASLLMALREIAQRLPAARAAEAVDAIATASLDRVKYVGVRGLFDVFRWAGCRVREADAESCVRRWWADLNGRFAAIGGDFVSALCGAAFRLPQAVAERWIDRWVDGAPANQSVTFLDEARGGLALAIASRTSGSSAWRGFQKWLPLACASTVPSRRLVYLRAVGGACTSLPDANVMDAVEQLFAALRATADLPTRKHWTFAIGAIAGRVPADASVDLFGIISRASEDAALVDVKRGLLDACADAAARAPPEHRATAAMWTMAAHGDIPGALDIVRATDSLAAVTHARRGDDGLWSSVVTIEPRVSLALSLEFRGVPAAVRSLLAVPAPTERGEVTAPPSFETRGKVAASKVIGPQETWKIILDVVKEGYPKLYAKLLQSGRMPSARTKKLDQVREIVEGRDPAAVIARVKEGHRNMDEERFKAALEDPGTLLAIVDKVIGRNAGSHDESGEANEPAYYVCAECGLYNHGRVPGAPGKPARPGSCSACGKKPARWSRKHAHPTQPKYCHHCKYPRAESSSRALPFVFAVSPTSGKRWNNAARRGNQCPKCARFLKSSEI